MREAWLMLNTKGGGMERLMRSRANEEETERNDDGDKMRG